MCVSVYLRVYLCAVFVCVYVVSHICEYICDFVCVCMRVCVLCVLTICSVPTTEKSPSGDSVLATLPGKRAYLARE